MAEGETLFAYVAVDAAGRRVKGSVAAADDGGAFERLKREGLSPVSIRAAQAAAAASGHTKISDRGLADLLSDLASLLGAGADMRTAFAIVGSRGDVAAVRNTARAIGTAIAGGVSIESAFGAELPARFDFIAALIAAGEAGGDVAGGLRRAADLLTARVKLREQLISIVSYPAFVFASTLVALGVILFGVIPTLAPLVRDAGGDPPVALSVMIATSSFLTGNAGILAAATCAMGLLILACWRFGLLRGPVEALLLDGPARRTVRGLAYGAFAVALGEMLDGGAPTGEALRLATRAVGLGRARDRLEPLAQAVRQGASLPTALDTVRGFPSAIGRLATVGEVSGAVGAMIARAGRLEEAASIRRLEDAGRLLGPALIVFLGAVIGLMMGGLLSGVSQLGQSALN